MKKTIILKSAQQFSSVLTALDSIKADDDIHQVEIRPYKKNLSAEQRGLYFKWIQILSLHTGATKEDAHLEYKKLFLAPIFEREKEWYRELIESVRTVYRNGDTSIAAKMHSAIMKLTSIRDADTKEMSEYMSDLRMFALNELNVTLPLPEDDF